VRDWVLSFTQTSESRLSDLVVIPALLPTFLNASLGTLDLTNLETRFALETEINLIVLETALGSYSSR
jgi:hypothetical protein